MLMRCGPDAAACDAVMLPAGVVPPILELSGILALLPLTLFVVDRAGGNGGATALPADRLPLRWPEAFTCKSILVVGVLEALPTRSLCGCCCCR